MAGDARRANENEHNVNPIEYECLRKHYDSADLACEKKLWYHGKLGRLAAEELLSNHQEGSYLVRDSESRLGSFVLSYLGNGVKITHFRILAMCGEYYIGGRQFESLADLILYYTNCSCLLRDEQLKFPVAPHEPVDDGRRVTAMLSYRKAAGSDELSFCKGDTFVIQNEMDDGWLWAVSERTCEGGLVPSAFVKDRDCDLEPVEDLPYFHSSISKEEAVEKLQRGGQGSYLVRRSENFPGDFSLFFLCDNEVRRFRIENHGSRFIVGGRLFESLDSIVQRYRQEEIVEGHTLGSAVDQSGLGGKVSCFEKVVTDGPDDIYSSVRPSTGPMLVTRTNDRVEMSGYLHLYNDKTKRFKPYYFVLNGSERMLYYFENEKRSKPKGIVELVYTSIYPIHDSLFGRPNCFLLSSTYDNQARVLNYVSAENSDTTQRWTHALKASSISVCGCDAGTGGGGTAAARPLRTLSITVFSAHHVSDKLLSHATCVIALNQHRVARTQLCDGGDPFWDEEFHLDDIPLDVESFTISLLNAKRNREMLIGSVTMPLSSLDDAGVTDKHYPMDAALLPKGKVGSLRFRTVYRREMVLPLAEYSALKQLLLMDGFQNTLLLAKLCPMQEWPALAKTLLYIFSSEQREVTLLRTLNEWEIDKEGDVATLFRGTTLATTLMDQYMKMTSAAFVKQALHHGIHKIMDLKHSCELNPARLDGAVGPSTNVETLLGLLSLIAADIFKAVDACPRPLRYLCHCLQRRAQQKWPHDESVRSRVVSSFIFLRLLSPAIFNPRSFSLTTENPSEMAYCTLKIVAKVLQMLANLVDAGPKQTYMEAVQPFISQHRGQMVKFLDDIACVLEIPKSDTALYAGDVGRELATVHRLCASNLDHLYSLLDHQPSVKRIVTVTEALMIQERLYTARST